MLDWEQIEAQWKQFGEHAKTKWNKLTDDDLRTLAGKKDLLVTKIEERYGIVKKNAAKQVDLWLGKLRPALEVIPEEKAPQAMPPAAKT